MDGNDIGTFESIGQACMFEGVLASPPNTKARRFFNRVKEGVNNWESSIATWTTNELAVKSLADCTNRRFIGTEVYTFLSPDAVDPINHWLIRKGISVPVYWYPDIEAVAEDLKYNRGIKVFMTSNYEDAKLVGPRATVVGPTTIWVV